MVRDMWQASVAGARVRVKAGERAGVPGHRFKPALPPVPLPDGVGRERPAGTCRRVWFCDLPVKEIDAEREAPRWLA
jgi:hypothetical protein